MSSNIFAGLPSEFSPPEKTAMHIATLNTIAEREAYWLRLPQQWRGPFVGHLVELAIARRICDMPEKIQRQNALASVPDLWRENVRWQVVRMWRHRELLAQDEAVA